MDEPNIDENDDLHQFKTIPVLSEYVKTLETHVKQRYLEKISLVGVDPASIPIDEFDPECLPPIEAADLVSYLVLETSYYTKQQFKAYKSLEAYNQMVSGFITSVQGKLIAGKFVVMSKVRHSQRMNDPLIQIWIIVETDGSIVSAHCLGCKAGLAEACSHVASVMFYIEAWNRLKETQSCTQVKCTWLLPAYVKDVPYARVRDIDLSSAKKLKDNLDNAIDSIDESQDVEMRTCKPQRSSIKALAPTEKEKDGLLDKFSKSRSKAVCLSVKKLYSKHFVSESRKVPVVTDLFKNEYLDLAFPALLQQCLDTKLSVSDEQIKQVERDSREQAKSSEFFRHRAGRIGASVSGSVCHSNIAQPSQSLIKSICYPNLYKFNSKAIKHGIKYEPYAIKAYEITMKRVHKNFEIVKCGLFINKDFPFLHATPDFLTYCDCCGFGCGEVKCPLNLRGCDFKNYAADRSTCIDEKEGKFSLRKDHNYYQQVQQQLFTVPDRAFCDFVLCGIDSEEKAHIVVDRILPDKQHMDSALSKLEAFWRHCILPEVLGRWYTRKLPAAIPDNGDRICFCRNDLTEPTITCDNTECPYKKFHSPCLGLGSHTMPKGSWYCPHCSRLPQFKKQKSTRSQKEHQSAFVQEALNSDSICVCGLKATMNEKLIECHNTRCTHGKYFHLTCLGYKRMPNNAKTTWQCHLCKAAKCNVQSNNQPTTCPSYDEISEEKVATNLVDPLPDSKQQPTTCTSSSPSICLSSDNGSDDEVVFTHETVGVTNKTGLLGNLTENDLETIIDPNGWLDCNIIQQAQVLLQQANPFIDGFQRTTLGPIRNFDVLSGEFVQILHTGSDHWVTISSIGCQPGIVHLYDSLYNDVILTEVKEQTQDLLGGRLENLTYVPTQQQNNGSDCGIFAVAIATCLTLGMSPTHVTFDIPKMRTHLAHCLKQGKIDMFPHF